MRQGAEQDDDLGVVGVEAIIGDDRRLDVVLRQLPQELERDVRDDLHVDPRVVVDSHPCDGVDVRGVPPCLQLRVVVHTLEDPPQLPVPAHGDVDAHLRNGLGGGQARFALSLRRDGLFDPLLGLPIEIHRARV